MPKPEVNKPNIDATLAGLVVDIADVNVHPDTAHTDSAEPSAVVCAVMASLARFGQMKPVIVQASTGLVVAGNATVRAATNLGWERIAALLAEMSDAEAAAYLRADNKVSKPGWSRSEDFDLPLAGTGYELAG